MKWLIPAKTFLLGEYVAIAGGPAIVLTTQPCFELSYSNQTSGLTNIHPDSPAGKWWYSENRPNIHLTWYDPYSGCGGLGASSAQFVGLFRAWHDLLKIPYDSQKMLESYQQYAWNGTGLPPSGYDVLAQSMYGCVRIDQKKIMDTPKEWKFKDLAFILLHTGNKLATHEHLATLTLSNDIAKLSNIVFSAMKAFEANISEQLIQAINDYHNVLTDMNLVAAHSQNMIQQLKSDPDILAIKGCGAMGSDILCLFTRVDKLYSIKSKLRQKSYFVIATSDNLYKNIQEKA